MMVKFLIPCPWGLFESIKGLVELANIMRSGRILKAWRLSHEDSFIECAMKKGIGDIELSD